VRGCVVVVVVMVMVVVVVEAELPLLPAPDDNAPGVDLTMANLLEGGGCVLVHVHNEDAQQACGMRSAACSCDFPGHIQGGCRWGYGRAHVHGRAQRESVSGRGLLLLLLLYVCCCP